MSLDEAFAPIEAHYRAQIIGATFGHLAPKPKEVYEGTVLFAHGEYHDLCVIRSTINVDDSPWFYEDLHGDYFWKKKIAGKRIVTGRVYKWTGTYRKLKNGKGRFVGTVDLIA